MKIIYLHQYFNTLSMFGSTRSYEFARRLVSRGHEVHVITSWRDVSDGDDWIETIEEGIHVHWKPIEYSNHMSFSKRIIAFFKFAFVSANKAASIKADLIFATSTPLTVVFPAAWAKFRLGIPIVFEVRDLWPELPIAIGALRNPFLKTAASLLEFFAYHNSKAVIALSPGMKDGVIKRGFPQKQIAMIPNCCDNKTFGVDDSLGLTFRNKRSWLGDSPLLLYAGTFGKINDVSYLIDLAVALKKIDSNIKILLIGRGSEFEIVRERANQQRVFGDNVFMESQMSKTEIVSALSAATVASALFLDLPEMRANSSNKFFDCLASGTPVFLNYGGWMSDLVTRRGCGLSGWGVPISEVAVLLNNKINNVSWLKAAGTEAKKLASEDFDRDVLADKFAQVLEAAAKDGVFDAEIIAPGNIS